MKIYLLAFLAFFLVAFFFLAFFLAAILCTSSRSRILGIKNYRINFFYSRGKKKFIRENWIMVQSFLHSSNLRRNFYKTSIAVKIFLDMFIINCFF